MRAKVEVKSPLSALCGNDVIYGRFLNRNITISKATIIPSSRPTNYLYKLAQLWILLGAITIGIVFVLCLSCCLVCCKRIKKVLPCCQRE